MSRRDGTFPGVGEPVFPVCAHARRDACYARFGGHRLAANLVLLPHGLYYGPVGVAEATAAIGAYAEGTVLAQRYRGRAGQPKPVQEVERLSARARWRSARWR